jgi:hypothetical protein
MVLGHCAELTEGGAWAKLQEHLLSLKACRATTSLADDLRGIRFQCVSTTAAQEVDGLNRPDNNRTYSTTFVGFFERFELTDLTRDRLQKFPEAL